VEGEEILRVSEVIWSSHGVGGWGYVRMGGGNGRKKHKIRNDKTKGKEKEKKKGGEWEATRGTRGKQKCGCIDAKMRTKELKRIQEGK